MFPFKKFQESYNWPIRNYYLNVRGSSYFNQETKNSHSFSARNMNKRRNYNFRRTIQKIKFQNLQK